MKITADILMLQRCSDINELLEEISKYDRHFFLNKEKSSLGNFTIIKGEIFYEDEYNKERKKVNFKRGWGSLDWVNHGGTLKAQIFDFAKFILNGEKIGIFSDHWGYCFESLKKIHHKAKELEIIEKADFRIYHYDDENTEHKETIYKEEDVVNQAKEVSK